MENHSRLHDEKCKTPEPFLGKRLGQTIALFGYDSLISTLPLASVSKRECSLWWKKLSARSRASSIYTELLNHGELDK